VNTRRLIGALALGAVASVFVYAIVAFATDAQHVAAAIVAFPWPTTLAMVALMTASLAVRAVRFRWLVGLAGAPLRAGDALYTQLSGTTMTLTPGKVGEILKAWLAKRFADLPISRGLAVVFTERVADLIAVLVLTAGGLAVLRTGLLGLAVAAAVVAVGTVVAASERFHRFALRFVESRPWARRHHASAEAIFATLRVTLSPGPLLGAVTLAAVAWGLEGLAFALCLRVLGFTGLAVMPEVALYAASTVVGALVFLPGGIGLTEASLAGLLVLAGASGTVATTATVLIRLVTLWWPVALGWAVFASRPSVLRGFIAGDAEAD
jgi:uncharacterized protein (TIRG00374 family)